MRIILKNSFFSVVCFLTVLFFGVLSCQRENGPVEQEPGSSVALESGEAALSFRVSTPVVGVDTKSVITDTYFETGIRSILILVLGEDGSWKSTYKEASSGYLSTGTGVAALDLDAVKVRACYQDYTVYAFVNMGNVMDNMPVDASGKPTPDAYVYSLPVAYPDLGTRGMPMCAKETVDTDDLPAGGQANVVLTLRRLMAKVVISVNKTGMTGENAGVLNSSIIRVRQVPRVIRPFAAGGSGALEVAELYGGVGASSTDTDYYSFSAGAAAGAAYHTNVTTLYVPENYQGVGSETNQEKKATAPGETPTGRQALATFLEYKASKSGTNDGISGNLTYEAYLGENVVNDYNVIGDKVYRATLNLSWNGLFYDGDWRVDNSDITDGRLLTLSDTPHTTSSSFTDWGRLRRNVASQLYVNFSRDGGASWVHSAKDIDGWPYGWDLYIDGVKQASGGSATAAGDLGWSYIGDPSRDQLFITPGPSSVASSVHTLQVKSADGRVVSNEVSFEVSQPLRLYWSNDDEKYVAQMPHLGVGDKEDNNATITYTIKDSSTGLELYAPSKTGVYVKTLAAGDYTITAAASNGQTGEITFTVNNPLVEQLWTSQMLWVDGTESERMFRYTTLDGTEMTKAEHIDYEGIGTKFSPSLYETLLKPRIASVVRGSSDYNSNIENLITISDECKLYVHTLKCTVAGNEIKVDSHLNYPIKVNVQAGVETVSYNTYFKDPFADVTNTSFSETFHDFTSMYAHISSTMKNTYGQSKNHALGNSSSGKMLYADASNVLIQASPTIETGRTALTGTYTNGSSYISIGLGAEGRYHPSGVNDVYIHVQNTYDKAASGDRAAYCLSKKIGTATIYLHVAWATIVKPKSYHGEYDIKVTNSGHYKKEHANDTWNMRYLCGGFLKQNDVESNKEVSNLTSSDFYTIHLSDGTGFYYYMGDYTLTNSYGFVASRFARNSADIAYGLGFAIMKTFSGNGHDTSTWSDWRTSTYTSPFCRYRAAFENWTGTGSWNGLTGYYYVSDKTKDYLKDGSGNGYVVAHFLQDLPVNPNNGYIE